MIRLIIEYTDKTKEHEMNLACFKEFVQPLLEINIDVINYRVEFLRGGETHENNKMSW